MQSVPTGFFNRQTLFLLFFCIIYFSLSLPAGYAGFNIDASWHESLVMAIDKGFVFGRDFIFTYGPLGYLNTGLMPKSVPIGVLVAAEVFTLLNYLIIIKFCFQKAGKNWWIVAISSLLIFMPWGFISDTSFTFFLLLFVLAALCTQNPQFGGFVVGGSNFCTDFLHKSKLKYHCLWSFCCFVDILLVD